MGSFTRNIAIVLFSLLIAACWGHSFPDSTTFIRPVDEPVTQAETVHVFVDANGTFYPTGWDSKMGRPHSWKADSLLNESANDTEFRQMIVAGEREQLAELDRFGQDRDRIFVLVHGYNNTQDEALRAYQEIEKRLDVSASDGIVRFYWDGLTGSGIGGAKIWFNATGYSQLAGSRGLRRVLASFSGKEIFLISHSRGASVLLSALDNPVYAPDFLGPTQRVATTWGTQYEDFLSPPALKKSGNSYQILALAPAIDRIDFCDVRNQPSSPGQFRCENLRALEAVSSFRYTVNREDPVLKKFVGLSGGFNPTGLGLNPDVGRDLAKTYDVFRAYPLEPGNGFHSFGRYVESVAFAEMLDDAGILRPRR